MNDKLTNIVRYAYKTVPFFMRMGTSFGIDIENEDIFSIWNEIPITNKDMLLKDNDSLLSVEYISSAINRKIRFMSTSGSTGKCLDIYWDNESYNRSMLSLWIYRKKYYGISTQDHLCFFFTGRNVGGSELEFEYGANELGFGKCALDKDKIKSIYMKMLEYKPKWMLLQPSIAMLLCQSIREYNLPRIESLQYIELSGEMLFNEVRKEIKDVFGCAIANQYGCNEVNSIAYECKCGHLHCMCSNIFIEILENGNPVSAGEEGDIYITSLHNHAMPMVRYCVGDRGILHPNKKCKCGNKAPVLQLTTGRNNDWILNKDGSKVNTYIFVRTIEIINSLLENIIKQFQIVQNGYDDFTIKLVMNDDEYNEDQIKYLFVENLLQPSLEGAVFLFEFYELLFPEESNGKLMFFRNELTLS